MPVDVHIARNTNIAHLKIPAGTRIDRAPLLKTDALHNWAA